MKEQLTLTQIAAEIERQAAAKRDFVADTRRLEMVDPKTLQLQLTHSTETLAITPHAHSQIASALQIPKTYYDRLSVDQPELLATNVNTLWHKEPKRRMVRSLDGKARAVVSDRFSTDFDNYALADFLLPELAAYSGLRFESLALTETNFYLKAFYPSIQAEVKKGDVLQAGFVVKNSEVGDGALQVLPMTLTLACLNGMTLANYGKRRAHIGKKIEEEGSEFFSDETRRTDARAYFLKVRDVIRSMLTQDSFEKILASLREATEVKIEGSVEGAVEVVRKTFSLGAGTSDGVLRHLINGGDLSIYGLANAVTRQSQDENDYEVATKLERDGGRIIELPRSAWREIVLADRPLKRAA